MSYSRELLSSIALLTRSGHICACCESASSSLVRSSLFRSDSVRVLLITASHLAKLVRKPTLTDTAWNCTARAFGLPSPLWAEIFAYFCLPAAAEQRTKLLHGHNSCGILDTRRRLCSSPGRISAPRASFPGVGAGAREWRRCGFLPSCSGRSEARLARTENRSRVAGSMRAVSCLSERLRTSACIVSECAGLVILVMSAGLVRVVSLFRHLSYILWRGVFVAIRHDSGIL